MSEHCAERPPAASWIWFETDETENVFVRARRKFTIETVPTEAVLRITCSGHYRLWVNGTFAGRGPARPTVRKKRYDVLDISPLLRQGANVLAVHLIHYGYATAHCPEAPGGFWCELDIHTDDDGRITVESDAEWRFSPDPAYDRNAGRRNQCYGIIEIYDARKEEDWLAPEFDDSAWSCAVECSDGPVMQPWEEMIPRGIPQCREESILPQAIVRIGEVENQEFVPGIIGGGSISNLATYLLQDIPLEPEYTSIENAESLLQPGGEPAVITQPSPLDRDEPHQRCATVILDFGREITGFGWLDVEGNEGAIVDVAYGERLVGGRVQAVMQNTAYADRYILKASRQRHEVHDWKGYRYVQLTFRNLTRPLLVHGAGSVFTSYPVGRVGAFECSDPMLTRVWNVGAYTQQLCMHDALMDCPWREQQQWLGDGRVQLLIIQNAFGDRAMPRKFIEQFAEAQLPSGMIPNVSLSTHYMTDYALWWVQGVLDVLLFDGDVEFSKSVFPNMAGLLEWFEDYVNADGLLEDVAGTAFIDWANVGREGICAPLNAIYYIARQSAAEIACATGNASHAEQWRETAEKVENAFHDTFWDSRRELYVDNVISGQRTEKFSQHTQAIAALAGLSRVDNTALLTRALEDKELVRTEPYFSFYLLEALARAGLAEKGLEFIREKWGAMIEQGATSFWEEWQVTGTFRAGRWIARPRSHCHAWSAAPTAWLSRYVLGVRVEEADGPIIVEPQPCGLDSASGVVPTRYGPVKIVWQIKDGRLHVEADIPENAPADFREPPGFEAKTQYRQA